jgi:hypothetical protein
MGLLIHQRKETVKTHGTVYLVINRLMIAL